MAIIWKNRRFVHYNFIIVVLVAKTKTAQIHFLSWFPAGMAASNPVSVLVHSSTLVTDGIY
jgi:NADH:ubiquinone oxidoreductase subunit 5 (subunit L)/multisubunit Na+/H+ antiporter MnhA subunit